MGLIFASGSIFFFHRAAGAADVVDPPAKRWAIFDEVREETEWDLGAGRPRCLRWITQIVGHQEARPRAPEAEHPHVCADPVRQALCPGRLRVGEIGRAQYGDEDLRLARRAGYRVDDRHLLAREVDEGLVTGNMRLPHARRQPALELPEQLAVAAICVAVSVGGAIFLPQDHQVDARTLQLTRDNRPVRLRVMPCSGTHATVGEQLPLQRLVGDRDRQWPRDPCRGDPREILAHRAVRDAQLTGNYPRPGSSTEMHCHQPMYPPHGQPLGGHPSLRSLQWSSGCQRDADLPDATSSRPPFLRGWTASSEWWTPSDRNAWTGSDQNGGRHQIRTPGRLPSESAAQDEQHRSFIERGWREGWWQELAESRPPGDVQSWLDRLEHWSAPEQYDQSFVPWRRTFVDLYTIARWLDEYVEVALKLPRIAQDRGTISLDHVLRPSYSPLGLGAAPINRSLGIGMNWMIRELLRHGVYPPRHRSILIPYCWVPSQRVREMLRAIGADVGAHADKDASPGIYTFVIDQIGIHHALFGGDFDLPLQLVTQATNRAVLEQCFRAGDRDPPTFAETDGDTDDEFPMGR